MFCKYQSSCVYSFGQICINCSNRFCRFLFQRMHIDNRIICFISLLLALMGSLISADWQSIGGDPCDQFSNKQSDSSNFTYYSNISRNSSIGSGFIPLPDSVDDLGCAADPGSFQCTAAKHSISLEQCKDDETMIANTSCVCEAFSGKPYHCFWNPQSRVTGRECPRCTELCRGRDKSLNFVQFLVGISLVSSCVPLGRITVTLIASDAIGRGSQVSVLCAQQYKLYSLNYRCVPCFDTYMYLLALELTVTHILIVRKY